MLTYILFILGFILLVKGADYLVDGASSLAHKLDIPKIIIGLTIVSLGTSLPELIINIIASIQGASDIGIGTIIGSNISNIALILGLTAIIMPISVRHATIWREIPYSILAAIILLIFLSDNFFSSNAVSRLNITESIILLIFFCLFILYTLVVFVKHKKLNLPKEQIANRPTWQIILMIITGLIGLYFGGQWVVDGAIHIARLLGLSEFVISATIIAVGTSLPELVTSLIAARKDNLDLAVGNIIGSNIFNILMILGIAGLINPIAAPHLIQIDLLYLIGLSIILFSFILIGKRKELDRWQGLTLLLIYAGYIYFLLARG